MRAWNIDDVSNRLPDIVGGVRSVFTDIGGHGGKRSVFARFIAGSDPKVDGLAKVLQSANVKPLRPLMNELRVNKSEAELDCMRKAGSTSGAVFTEAMRVGHRTEKQLWTDLAYGFKSQGLDGDAYVPRP